MTALIAILTSTAGKWIGMALAVIVPLFVAWRAAFNAGKNSEIAKDAKANDKALDRLNQANNARSDASRSGMSDDGFKRD